MAVHKKYPALGRGLDALISTKEVHTDGSSTINEIELDKISPNPNQPRRDFALKVCASWPTPLRKSASYNPSHSASGRRHVSDYRRRTALESFQTSRPAHHPGIHTYGR